MDAIYPNRERDVLLIEVAPVHLNVVPEVAGVPGDPGTCRVRTSGQIAQGNADGAGGVHHSMIVAGEFDSLSSVV